MRNKSEHDMKLKELEAIWQFKLPTGDPIKRKCYVLVYPVDQKLKVVFPEGFSGRKQFSGYHIHHLLTSDNKAWLWEDEQRDDQTNIGNLIVRK